MNGVDDDINKDESKVDNNDSRRVISWLWYIFYLKKLYSID